MKLPKIVFTACIALAFAIVGCSNNKSSVDTAPLEKSFQSADAPTKSTSDSIVSEIKNANYSGAMSDLTKLAENTKLTPDQQQAIKDVLAQVQKAMSDTASNAMDSAKDGANKAASDLQNSLPKK
jgi:hypothetical protein